MSQTDFGYVGTETATTVSTIRQLFYFPYAKLTAQDKDRCTVNVQPLSLELYSCDPLRSI
jgi:hypothetical protein